MRTFLIFLCLVAAIVSSALGQDVQSATIRGYVVDASNDRGLHGANVSLDGTPITVHTDSDGYYVLPHIPAGTYTLTVVLARYRTHQQEISLMAREEQDITIRLETEAARLGEVLVTGEKTAAEKLFQKDISQVRLSAEDIKQFTQVAEPDVLRALQSLPGVLSVSDFSSALYVRGGTPDQNLYLMDGTEVYNPEHAFGLFSTFNPDAIKQVELSRGGFGANYGGRLSSVLDVTNLDGSRGQFRGTASISLLSAKTTIQTPIGDIGSVLGAIRRTYFDQTVGRFSRSIPSYYFLDGNIKAFFDLSDRNKLTISGYEGRDRLHVIFNTKVKDESGLNYDWGNRAGSIRWTYLPFSRLFANLAVTGSRFDSDADLSQTFDSVFAEKNVISDVSVKGDLEYHVADAFRLRLGFEQKSLHLTFRHQFESGTIDIDTHPKQYAAYLTGNWQPLHRLDAEGGVRYNLFDAQERYRNLAPRFSAKYRLTDSLNLKVAGGQFYQYLHRVTRAFFVDNWVAANPLQPESSSRHAIIGISRELSEDAQVEVEAFYRDYSNLYLFNDNFAVDITPEAFDGDVPIYTQTDGLFNRGDGHSKGVEVFLRKRSGGMTGTLGYNLSFTRYTFDRLNQGNPFPPRHDRTHSVTLTGNLDWKNFRRWRHGEAPIQHASNWRFGLTFVYTSGQPITLPGSTYFVNTMPDWDFETHEVYPSVINAFRLPPYIRLDLSVTYERHYKNWSIFPYLQIVNAGNRKNIWFVDYDALAVGGKFNSTIETMGMFPILPTIGVNIEF